ncbi:hypothetical protein [Streptomyces xanthophaeus]|uniref:hypothetical protein n=1 Tax=Streptomyces xanthophaeus TaxID=67385 RepID=UPI0037235411
MWLIRAVWTAAVALLLMGCAGTPTAAPATPASGQAQDDLIKSAQRALVTRCLAGKGLTLPTTKARPESPEDKRLQAALFGTGPRELALKLPTGYTVTANTDGCLANAQRTLYGDQKTWFRAEVIVNNLRAEAQSRMTADPDHRAAMARWTHCTDQSAGNRPQQQPDRATADRCHRESGLAEIEARLEPALLAKVRTERRDQLSTYKRLRAVALRRAQNLAGATRPLESPVGQPTG